MMDDKKYEVFISYAHADAQTHEQKKIVNLIKTAIEKALQKVLRTKSSLVFLDSDALTWGDEWSAKIIA